MRTSSLLRSFCLFLIIFILTARIGMSQVTVGTNNAGGGTEFVGWNNLFNSKDLDIKNENSNQSITIQNGGFPASLRMFFDPFGNVGVGDNTTPLSLFHLHCCPVKSKNSKNSALT